jgi:hypothetical protein
MKTESSRQVTLSQYHAGQMVTPYVIERFVRGLIEVEIGWKDSSDRTVFGVEIRRFRRGCGTAGAWVASRGIETDDYYSEL